MSESWKMKKTCEHEFYFKQSAELVLEINSFLPIIRRAETRFLSGIGEY